MYQNLATSNRPTQRSDFSVTKNIFIHCIFCLTLQLRICIVFQSIFANMTVIATFSQYSGHLTFPIQKNYTNQTTAHRSRPRCTNYFTSVINGLAFTSTLPLTHYLLSTTWTGKFGIGFRAPGKSYVLLAISVNQRRGHGPIDRSGAVSLKKELT